MTKNEQTAEQAFKSKCVEIDGMLEKVNQLRNENFNTNPSNVNWSNVGSLDMVLQGLNDILSHYGLAEETYY